MKLTLKTPSVTWGEALPLGNGHMGAMVYSGVKTDQIDLSENTFFSGQASLHNNQPGAHKAFYEMRRQLADEDFAGAHETAAKFIGQRENYGTNLPVGQLLIHYEGGETTQTVKGYQRSINIMDGIVEADYDLTGDKISAAVHYSRTTFISHPHNILAYRACTTNGSLVANIELKGSNDLFQVVADPMEGIIGLKFKAFARETIHSDGSSGVNLFGYLTVVTDGQLDYLDNVLKVSQGTELILYLGMTTDFDITGNTVPAKTYQSDIKQHVLACARQDFSLIYAAHIRDIQSKMNRVSLAIEETSAPADPTESEIPFLFQYGRYLLLSASREDSKLPAHLQGIWNDNVACRIGWTCDMHLDINTQMNYWPSEITRLPETNLPLFHWIEQALVTSGRITAGESYGLGGWTADLVSNAWGFTAPYWAIPISPCPTGGVWILTHLWEHYLFSQDKEFLENQAYPVIKEGVQFFVEYVFEDKTSDYLTCGPSISPESSFIVEDKIYQISNGCTYEITMIRELFLIFLAASEQLNLENDLVCKVRRQLERLLPFHVDKDGTLAEWDHPYPAADSQHRHTSHLLGLFPFSQISIKKTPAIAKAAQATINRRLCPQENWEDTGWARSLVTLYAARLRDSSQVYSHIQSLLQHLMAVNRMVIHPPTRGAGSFADVYELDGNTGITTAIAETLLQSQDGVIHLLPALPKQWIRGCVRGLYARGGVEVNIYWENGILEKAEFTSTQDCHIEVVYKDRLTHVDCLQGQRVTLGGAE